MVTLLTEGIGTGSPLGSLWTQITLWFYDPTTCKKIMPDLEFVTLQASWRWGELELRPNTGLIRIKLHISNTHCCTVSREATSSNMVMPLCIPHMNILYTPYEACQDKRRQEPISHSTCAGTCVYGRQTGMIRGPLFSWIGYEGTQALLMPQEIWFYLLPFAEYRNLKTKGQVPRWFYGMPARERFIPSILSFQVIFF